MLSYQEAYDKKVRFVRAELYVFRPLKLSRGFCDSTTISLHDQVPVDAWLRLYNQNGTMGECPCSGRMEYFLKQIITEESKSYREWYRLLHWEARNCGFSGETAVELGRLDLAFHDMLAKEEGLPLHRFLGAERDWAAVYASGMGTNLTIPEMEKQVQEFIDDGYTTFKMKAATDFGSRLEWDLERIGIVRSMIGEHARLAVDVNQLWKAEEALEFAKRIEKYDIAWLEEPVHSYDMLELEKLTRESPIPIAMGESPRCYYPMESYVKAGVAHLQPIPSNLSSVQEWLDTQALARRHGLELSSGGLSHLTASFIATGLEEDMVEYLKPVVGPLYDLMEKRPREEKGRFYLPLEPGISMSPDIAALERRKVFSSVCYY